MTPEKIHQWGGENLSISIERLPGDPEDKYRGHLWQDGVDTDLAKGRTFAEVMKQLKKLLAVIYEELRDYEPERGVVALAPGRSKIEDPWEWVPVTQDDTTWWWDGSDYDKNDPDHVKRDAEIQFLPDEEPP